MAGGPVMRIAESYEICVPFIAFFAMSGRWDKIVAGRGWRYAERPEAVSKSGIAALHPLQLLSPFAAA